MFGGDGWVVGWLVVWLRLLSNLKSVWCAEWNTLLCGIGNGCSCPGCTVYCIAVFRAGGGVCCLYASHPSVCTVLCAADGPALLKPCFRAHSCCFSDVLTVDTARPPSSTPWIWSVTCVDGLPALCRLHLPPQSAWTDHHAADSCLLPHARCAWHMCDAHLHDAVMRTRTAFDACALRSCAAWRQQLRAHTLCSAHTRPAIFLDALNLPEVVVEDEVTPDDFQQGAGGGIRGGMVVCCALLPQCSAVRGAWPAPCAVSCFVFVCACKCVCVCAWLPFCPPVRLSVENTCICQLEAGMHARKPV